MGISLSHSPSLSLPESRPIAFYAIPDTFHTLEEVMHALRKAGLESSNLVIGIDFTKSNKWQGENCFGGNCLHAMGKGGQPVNGIGRGMEWKQAQEKEEGIVSCRMKMNMNMKQVPMLALSPLSKEFGKSDKFDFSLQRQPSLAEIEEESQKIYETKFDLDNMNPYEATIAIVGKTLEEFDDDHLIPVFGFGDSTSTDKSVLPLGQGPNSICIGFENVLKAYRRAVPNVILAGPTSFAPLIHKTISIVEKNARSYHILLIIADGQVTNVNETAKAIVEASKYPISIIMVGVGDGPFDMMSNFDDELPERQFDNFQFVNVQELYLKHKNNPSIEALVAWKILQEIPEQFKLISKLRLL